MNTEKIVNEKRQPALKVAEVSNQVFNTEIVEMLRGFESISHHLNTIKYHIIHFEKDPKGYTDVINHTIELIEGKYNSCLPLISELRRLERNGIIYFNDGIKLQ